jgi:hypothetical protein
MGVTRHIVIGVSLIGIAVAALSPLPAFAVQRMPLLEQFVGTG